MGVAVYLSLFEDPWQELLGVRTFQGQQLRDLALRLHRRLDRAADTLDTLTAAGWDPELGTYDLILHHDGAHTKGDAIGRLRSLGLDPNEFAIFEDREENGGVPRRGLK